MKYENTLFVSDLDGTLLRNDQTVSKFTADTVNSLTEKGVNFSYATARSYATSSKVAAGITTKIPVIVYNGTLIIESGTERRISEKLFTPEESKMILDILTDGGVYPIVYSMIDGEERFSYCRESSSAAALAFIDSHRGDRRENPTDPCGLCRGDAIHFACIDSAEKLRPVHDRLEKLFPCVYYKEQYTGEMFLEIHPNGATKADAILELKNILGCDRVVCFGDGKNDISMFRIADEAYAVANAVPELIAVADAVIEDNENDGVAKWLLENLTQS